MLCICGSLIAKGNRRVFSLDHDHPRLLPSTGMNAEAKTAAITKDEISAKELDELDFVASLYRDTREAVDSRFPDNVSSLSRMSSTDSSYSVTSDSTTDSPTVP